MVQDQYVHLVKSTQSCWGASHCHQQGSTKTYFLQATASMYHIPLLIPRHNWQAPRSNYKSCYKVISCTLISHSPCILGSCKKQGHHSCRINNLEMLKIEKKKVTSRGGRCSNNTHSLTQVNTAAGPAHRGNAPNNSMATEVTRARGHQGTECHQENKT